MMKKLLPLLTTLLFFSCSGQEAVKYCETFKGQALCLSLIDDCRYGVDLWFMAPTDNWVIITGAFPPEVDLCGFYWEGHIVDYMDGNVAVIEGDVSACELLHFQVYFNTPRHPYDWGTWNVHDMSGTLNIDMIPAPCKW